MVRESRGIVNKKESTPTNSQCLLVLENLLGVLLWSGQCGRGWLVVLGSCVKQLLDFWPTLKHDLSRRVES